MQSSIFLIAKLFVTKHPTCCLPGKKKPIQQPNTVREMWASLLQKQGIQRHLRIWTKLVLWDWGQAVEFKLLKATFKKKLPMWLLASISSVPWWRRHAITATPASPWGMDTWLDSASQFWLLGGKFPPINGQAERTRTKPLWGACLWVGPVC